MREAIDFLTRISDSREDNIVEHKCPSKLMPDGSDFQFWLKFTKSNIKTVLGMSR